MLLNRSDMTHSAATLSETYLTTCVASVCACVPG